MDNEDTRLTEVHHTPLAKGKGIFTLLSRTHTYTHKRTYKHHMNSMLYFTYIQMRMQGPVQKLKITKWRNYKIIVLQHRIFSKS